MDTKQTTITQRTIRRAVQTLTKPSSETLQTPVVRGGDHAIHIPGQLYATSHPHDRAGVELGSVVVHLTNRPGASNPSNPSNPSSSSSSSSDVVKLRPLDAKCRATVLNNTGLVGMIANCASPDTIMQMALVCRNWGQFLNAPQAGRREVRIAFSREQKNQEDLQRRAAAGALELQAALDAQPRLSRVTVARLQRELPVANALHEATIAMPERDAKSTECGSLLNHIKLSESISTTFGPLVVVGDPVGGLPGLIANVFAIPLAFHNNLQGRSPSISRIKFDRLMITAGLISAAVSGYTCAQELLREDDGSDQGPSGFALAGSVIRGLLYGYSAYQNKQLLKAKITLENLQRQFADQPHRLDDMTVTSNGLIFRLSGLGPGHLTYRVEEEHPAAPVAVPQPDDEDDTD